MEVPVQKPPTGANRKLLSSKQIHDVAKISLSPRNCESRLDSQEVRDAFYKDWLARKEERRILHVKAMKEKATKEQAVLIEKKLSREEKCKRCVSEWRTNKELSLRVLQQRKAEMENKEKFQEEEKNQRRVESVDACKAWLQEKSEKLKEPWRQEKIAETKEKEKNEEEIEEKRMLSQKAFDAWASKKVADLAEEKKKERKKSLQVLNKSIDSKEQKQTEAATAFRAWKKKKDMHIKTVGKMYTYHPNPREPPKSSKWCPARSMKYDYPCDKKNDLISTGKVKASMTSTSVKTTHTTTKDNHHLDDTYSLESFDNHSNDDQSVDEHISDISSENNF